MLKVLFFILALSCSPEPSKLPNQDKAIAIIWRQTYSMTNTPPSIEWIANLNCANDLAFIDQWGRCVSGLFFDETWLAVLAHPANWTFHQMALAHELAHAKGALEGNPDPNHLGPYFQPGGLVDIANQALIKEGL